MNYSDKERTYLKVKHRVDKLKAFYTHLAVYAVVNGVIYVFKIIRNLRRGESFEEAFFDFSISGIWLIWGIVLAIHAFSIFGLPLILGKNWEEEKIQKFMEDEKNSNLN
jgi:hypothetical protein